MIVYDAVQNALLYSRFWPKLVGDNNQKIVLSAQSLKYLLPFPKAPKVPFSVICMYIVSMMLYQYINHILPNFSHLNSSVAHIVIVAEDCGQPPRRASVPVVVRYFRFAGSSRFGHAKLKLAIFWIVESLSF